MLAVLSEMLKLLLIDALFVGACLLGLVVLTNKMQAASAVMKRNFVGYFSNPTGYVFLCLFVLLTSVAAFCPHEFFAANLANLDQLNKYLPYIMLMFIPAITMSIWAEERRQGTDELLLTLPAGDFDIVIGKYLAAAAIFTCSLLFSQLSNYMVLIALSKGELDTGLLVSTYFGYWLVGLAMLALGMVASFLTSNLTVGFILGALINVPLAFASHADTLASSNLLSRSVARWGLLSRMDDFGRGVFSLSSFTYFAAIVLVGLYLSMVLIGRRHWSGGADGTSMIGHYLARAVSIAVIGIGLVLVFTWKDARLDVTEGRVSSLSPDTLKLLRDLDTRGRTIYIDAFVSAEVPDTYVQTKFGLMSMLKEFQSRAPGKIALTIKDDLEPFSESAEQAGKYGIRPEPIRTMQRGQINDTEVIMGAVFRCGLDKVVVPFFDYGIPVEYELIRSVCTVSQSSRKRVGILRTAAQMFGGFSMAGGRPQSLPPRDIVTELQKQYDVRDVDPGSAIPTDEYDVLVVVQPSSLSPDGMDNLLNAIRAGVPTAVFEDPLPAFMGDVPGTADQNQSPASMMGMGGGGPQPKSDIRRLWNLLGVQAPGKPGGPSGFQPDIVWQTFNPYAKLRAAENVNDSWVFASSQAPGADDSISMGDKITSKLDQIFFPMPGCLQKAPGSELKFSKLVTTSKLSGLISAADLRDTRGEKIRFSMVQGEATGEHVLTARITGYLEDDEAAMQGPAGAAESDGEDAAGESAGDSADDKASDEPRPVDVVYVSDIDVMSNAFLRLRARPGDVGFGLNFQFENVTFLLNIVDVLAKDDDYVDIRKRKPHLATLQLVEERIEYSRQEELKQEAEFRVKFEEAKKEAEDQSDAEIADLRKEVEKVQAKQQAGEEIDYAELNALQAKFRMKQLVSQRNLQVTLDQLERERSRNTTDLGDETERSIRRIQNTYKMWAVLLPPIPPLLVGILVFVQRRLRERESVARDPSRRRV